MRVEVDEVTADDAVVERWARSGAMGLCGRADGPALGPPDGLLAWLDRTAAGLSVEGGDPLVLLTERAAARGLVRAGTTSCGGATRLLRAADGWIAVSMARPDDVDLVPAWLETTLPLGTGGRGGGAADDRGGHGRGGDGHPGPDRPGGLGGGAPGDRVGTGDPAGPHGPGDREDADGPDDLVDPPWDVIAAHVAARSARSVLERATLLGLPVSVLGETGRRPGVADGEWLDATPEAQLGSEAVADGVGAGRSTKGSRDAAGGPAGGRPAGDALAGVRVVDLSSLWAGPLCGDLLAGLGADVVKAESITRPDGARRGNLAFYDRLNARKRSVALDLTRREGVASLLALIDRADVVIEASRPRALAQLGIDAERWVAGGAGRLWVSITGHGRSGAGADRVAFGDDAAVAGGLVVWEDGAPRFCLDAVADPLTGLAAAAAVVDARRRDPAASALLALAMAEVAASAAGPTVTASGPRPDDPPATGRSAPAVAGRPALPIAAPRSRPPVGRAPALGAHTTAVFAEWSEGR